jgi:glutaredoxin
MAARCRAHGLVVGSDGRCVICRREGARAAPKPAARRAAVPDGARVSGLWGWGLIAGITLVVGAGVAWVWSALPDSKPLRADASKLVPISAVEAKDEVARRDAEAPRDAAVVEAREQSIATPTVVRDVPDAPKPDPANPPSEADLSEALRSVQIKMYSASWCSHCTEARNWMRANKIAFSEYDVETNSAAKAEQRRINPKGGVPTLDVDGQVLVGFSEESLGHAIAQATQRRLKDRRR